MTLCFLIGQVASYVRNLSYFPNRAFHSQSAGILVVHRISKRRMGGKAFSYQAHGHYILRSLIGRLRQRG